MKRYLIENLDNIKEYKTDVLVIGSGIAGLFCALNIDESLNCIIINKAGIKRSNSMYAQGGVAGVISECNEGDNTDLHFTDTLTAGAGLCNEKAVRVLVDEANENLKKIIEFKIKFDSKKGKILLTKEGGHTKSRILHCGGDATGLHMTKGLYEACKSKKNVDFMDKYFLCDILTKDNKAYAITALDKNDIPIIINASKIVIASGGVGRVFRNSTNASCITGDGVAAAYRANVKLENMEFVQFHPTALIHPSETGRYFLISEAVRGEGGIIRNRKWEAFMKDIHPMADLAPRDIVSRAIISEMKKEDIPNVYLDITHKDRKFLQNRFPTIYNECMKRGIDIAKVWIPVVPVQHYFMGGIKTDLYARTNIKDLYACGEVASTGVHGANRLASNSLLECIVFSNRCAQDINIELANGTKQHNIIVENTKTQTSIKKEEIAIDFDSFASEIHFLSTLNCGIIRNEKDLKYNAKRLNEILEILESEPLTSIKGIITYNMAQVAMQITIAAISRKKSVGAHFRSDEK